MLTAIIDELSKGADSCEKAITDLRNISTNLKTFGEVETLNPYSSELNGDFVVALNAIYNLKKHLNDILLSELRGDYI